MDADTKRLLEPALSKIVEHFTSQIQQLEKRVECAETNVVTEAERVRVELRAEHSRSWRVSGPSTRRRWQRCGVSTRRPYSS